MRDRYGPLVTGVSSKFITRVGKYVAQPGLGTLPYPQLPGLGAWSVPAPALGEHTEAVLAELGL